ncbi:hybrid sensor histidine kinase/response regulator [Pseudorhizobium pelagicum]|uniref:hybrid sensor histidine kinase/response regulator n=1 Tax=Pseudorhizobium pelagicum TaxID=1509405 RepID=UPI001300C562|nr:PAS domain-containing protein [Pseudorhizobium pelagicum]MBA4785807.1 PAS domain-containing protein [Hyphomicrobiales bacterium]MDY6962284.1 PAS domain-containing protein [Pseudomonadota bacterium]
MNLLFNLSPNPYVLLDGELQIVGANNAYLKATMRTEAELLGRKLFDAFPSEPDSTPGKMLRHSFARVLETGEIDYLSVIPYPIAGPGGVLENRFWSATHTPIKDGDGKVIFILQHTVDVTELHRLRQAASLDGDLQAQVGVLNRADAVQGQNRVLGEEREYLRNLFEQAPGFMAVLREPEHVFTIANKAYRELVGRSDLIGKTIRTALPEVASQGFYEILDEVYRSGNPYSANAARILLKRQNDTEEERFLDFVYQPIRDASGAVSGIFVQGHDVTQLREAQETAKENEKRFRTLAQSLPNQVWTALPNGQIEWCNDEVYRYSGLASLHFDATTRSTMIHPDEAEAVSRNWQHSLRSGQPFEMDIRLRHHDGTFRWFISRAAPIMNSEGDIILWVATNTDIETQKKTESHLEYLAESLGQTVEARTQELERTQEVLRQSQKMEAIGNLAGGIAHDFNNLLQVITGNLQLLNRDVSGNDVAERRVAGALAGAARGARLASQLLSFGRRQPLEPKVINLSRLIREMDHLLRRSLGEAIEIDTIVSGGLWNTLVDPSNVENALLNLAINARDAMDGQGKLTIELGNAFLDDEYARNAIDVSPGQYVMLAVTDTGSGMTPDILEKVFDPFFTTKPDGKGTGLGLSMVYGFVKQSEGHIKIYSEAGSGTTVRIYLPRAMEAEDVLADNITGPVTGGSETVLVVEDEEAVRDVTVSLLTELGYKVLKAKDADSGLAIIESGAPIDLLFTDVVMPGRLKSRDLARKAKERLPTLGVLFTSGYTENSIVHGGRLDPGVNLLSKPYTREALARKIRQVLEQVRGKSGGQGMTEPETSSPSGPASDLPITVLICEDEVLIRISTVDYLQDIGMNVVEAGTCAEALAAAQSHPIDILITDVNLPDMSGLELTLKLRESLPHLPVIFATGDRTVPGSEVLEKTALITKPYDYDLLATRIHAMVTPRS